ncbi:unnamed protein product [Protopolystoma xenopodis]|uniref:Uncharacterized protein n=1 Tax=Protopolystoma xenopodis TaxID=117903 RepID=A0A3S5CC40_9PLAT|nr:unnamed protein product [Protopolystoma xenopodis]
MEAAKHQNHRLTVCNLEAGSLTALIPVPDFAIFEDLMNMVPMFMLTSMPIQMSGNLPLPRLQAHCSVIPTFKGHIFEQIIALNMG